MTPLTIAIIITTAVAVGFFVLLLRSRAELIALRTRFQSVLDADKEAARLRAEGASARQAAMEAAKKIEGESSALRERYAAAHSRMEALAREVSRLEETLEGVEVGLYNPHFTFADTEAYKIAIESGRRVQKEMIRNGNATRCAEVWTVGGSAREGAKMVKQTEKLILRAFNAEAEAAVANVTWNNYDTMRTRIEKAAEILNKHGTVLQITINPQYVQERLMELKLVYEAAEKRREEKEREREARAEQREEERVQKELQKAQEEAAKDEARFEKALAKARTELAAADDAERTAMLVRIETLEADLAAAQDRKARAIAQAQLTKVGHVYVISNMGAFGEDVVKIGMTRRLDPEERVRELGDASVPFPFDTHAMIYSENAPDLERRLHDHFWERRLNWANDRKEFFRVPLPEIQGALQEFGLPTELLAVPEAREFRQTEAALTSQRVGVTGVSTAPEGRAFPDDPFADS